ncbi:hypothetical protein QTG56_22445 (plasmid) [Rossellomorea sp. AcN35-11]|nr:hypothetical protein [Rossellomorea aquimaris]WJV32134.1 hypothetical protein QTG56_22445 [Rossellomorea sp. AcN35-11]
MSFYKEIPIALLLDFYVEIQNNLNKGILTEQMKKELKLIRKAAIIRGIKLSSLEQHSKQRDFSGYHYCK